MEQIFTLAVILREDQVLLARKLRSFGAGKWVGFGGKVERGESVEEAMVRECGEEVGVFPTASQAAGSLLTEHLQANGEVDQHRVYLFLVTDFEGVPRASDEMGSPTWFSFEDIPYDEMWESDRVWLPRVLRGERVEGEFVFDEWGGMVEHEIVSS